MATALVDRLAEPAALLDLDGSTRLINSAMETLLGRTRVELLGRAWLEMIAPPDDAVTPARFVRAIAERAARFTCATQLFSGRATLELDLARVGPDNGCALLVMVREVRYEPQPGADPVRHFEYEISTDAHDFGRLLALEGDAPLTSTAPAEQRWCYEELHQRSRPCLGCPALPGRTERSRTAVVADDWSQRTLTIVTAGPSSHGKCHLTAYALAPTITNDLARARVDALAESVGLSPREREILDLLLLGRNGDEIAQVLGISQRTVKFHQAKLLEKLGADTRLDLFRVLF